MTLILGLVVIFAWGTWLAFSHNVSYKSNFVKTFYISLSFLILATIIMLIQGVNPFTKSIFFFPFLGGIIWTLGGASAFNGTSKIGIARAGGIWAPINIICGFLWGLLYFKEFENLSLKAILLIIISIVTIISGILLIIFSKGTGGDDTMKKDFIFGSFSAILAGILWGSYYIPMKILDASPWITSFPFALGMVAGSLLFVAIKKVPLKLENNSDYIKTALTGVVWGIGNYTMLLLVDRIGAGRGFTISQLCVVVNALVGIFIFKDPKPKSKAALIAFIGIILALAGGIYLGTA